MTAKETLISPVEAAALIGTTVATLATLRHTGKGPTFFKQGESHNGRILYDRGDCIAYRDSRKTVRRVSREVA